MTVMLSSTRCYVQPVTKIVSPSHLCTAPALRSLEAVVPAARGKAPRHAPWRCELAPYEKAQQRLKVWQPIQETLSLLNGSSDDVGPSKSVSVLGVTLKVNLADLPVFEAMSYGAALYSLKAPPVSVAIRLCGGHLLPSAAIMLTTLGFVALSVQTGLALGTRALESHVKELRKERRAGLQPVDAKQSNGEPPRPE